MRSSQRWSDGAAALTENFNDPADSGESDCSSTPSTPEMRPTTIRDALELIDTDHLFLPVSAFTRTRALTGLSCAGNMWTHFVAGVSPDSIPEMYLGVHSPQDPSLLRHRVHRIVPPCQAYSIMSGNKDLFHLTAHPGYAIKLPSDTEHNNKDRIKSITSFSKTAARATGAIAKLVPNAPSIPVDGTIGGLSSLGRTAGNRARLMNAGIHPDELYRPRRIVPTARDTMEEVLRYAAADSDEPSNITGGLQGLQLHDGSTVWVCRDCLECIRHGRNLRQDHLTLAEYKSLTTKETELEVTLTNLESVITFTRTLQIFKKVQGLVLNIDSGCFEAPDMSEQHRTCFTNHFNDLGVAIRRQKSLTHLKIIGGNLESKIYGGLQCALLSYSLKSLHISGVCRFFEDRSLRMRRRYLRSLKRIELDNVRVHTGMAGDNLRKMINKRNLEVLIATRAGITSQSAAHVFVDEKKKLRKPFKKFRRLVLAHNDLATDDVINLLEVILVRRNPKLNHLDITGNQRIGQEDDRQRIENALRARKCLAVLEPEN
ncbi:hypothetical protein B0O80DRAFT_440716 [Mortierella sp. GBAus27b]|nr:hypothetical protein BGX31_004251 [Mortierella sp. GBA43]KAI8359635.1 hypothetical protein B0O80DRAFT_440716 [Mortierella sp. GBAus27b]